MEMGKEVGLTVEEIIEYQKTIKPVKHVYGKYGTLAKHATAKYWSLVGDLPEYLHGIDRQAAELYETMYKALSQNEQYKKTGDFIKDLQRETEIQHIIEEEILHELVYVD